MILGARKAMSGLVPAMVLAMAGVAFAASQPSRPAQASAGDVRVSRIIGSEVRDRSGRPMGQVEDLVVDTRDGRVAYALVATNENAEVGGQRVAIPIGKLGTGGSADRVVLEVDAAQLRTYPLVKPGEDPDWSEIDESLRATPRELPAAPAAVSRQRFVVASRMLSAEIRDPGGARVGNVQDIVLAAATGRIRHGVAQVAGRGEPVALPITGIQPEVGGNDLVLQVEREALRDAPAYTPRG